jgi:FtsP/CotA-like multicopper oxidase with cupredoxin domain
MIRRRSSWLASALAVLAGGAVAAIGGCTSMNGMDGMGGLGGMGGMGGLPMPPAPEMISVAPWSGTLGTTDAIDEDPSPDVVEFDLRAAPGEIEYLPGKPAEAWTFNGTIPGPIIRAKVGDSIVVHFTNDLPEPTSIHWHGVRVPNAMDGAGPATSEIPAGGTFDYQFTALDAGTFWYHPHVEASAQVDMGLYGVLVVDDPAAPALPSVDEAILVLDDVLLDPETGARGVPDEMRVQMMGLDGNLALVSGRRSNVGVTVRAGDLYRFRLVNAANARFFRLALPGGTMIRVGSDGGLLEVPETITELLLTPGERADVLARVDAPSTTATLRAMPHQRMMTDRSSVAIDLVRLTAGADPAVEAELPATLRTIAPLGEPDVTRTITLSEQTKGMRTTFLINDAAYPDVPLITAALGTVEEWSIVNDSDMDHPFHVHGFFFQTDGAREWKDTVNVPRKATVKARIDFGARDGVAGGWMYHCHILEHAERGMLGEVLVQ